MLLPILIPVLTAVQVAPAPVDVRPAGTRVTDLTPGTGPVAEAGRMVAVHYTGWLYLDGGKGRRFDSSHDRGQPFVFTIGAGDVILGWDEGLPGMRVGGKRRLIVPALAGYGTSGAGTDIPPGATLLFEIELLAMR